MKGACAGVHKNDVYATIDYFLIENFEDETGGKQNGDSFPITVRENEEEKWSNLEAARNRVRRAEKEIEEERCSLLNLEKKMDKANERIESAAKLF
ncbi:hypothetical protein Bca52824_090966 [Brassica carinata]|uniref:Uncharacterized protein n=1 Tax=Brassica carinata TaxID=52824 RepID=A0A8X7NVC3_BRACI|nr:hypothetical protein Bca52824_090966 [Brassica carinata]